jgi:hypothetical protein
MRIIGIWMLLLVMTACDAILLRSDISVFIYIGIIMSCVTLIFWFMLLDRLIS